MLHNIDLDSLDFGGMSYDDLLAAGLITEGENGDGLSYFERLAAERLEQKNAFTAELKKAVQLGADLSQTPQGFIRSALGELEQDAPAPDWAAAPKFEQDGWEQKVRFRCSNLGLMMTGQDGGKAAQKRLKQAKEKVLKLAEEYNALRQKDLDKFELAKQAEAEKSETAKTEAARQKAAQKLAELGTTAEFSASTQNKFDAFQKALTEFEGLSETTQFAAVNPLSASAKRVCEDLFATAFFGYDAPKKALSFLHGTAFEGVCLERYGLVHNIEIPKNSERITLGLLTGECDVNWTVSEQGGARIIRENKAPVSAESFIQQVKKNKAEYFWQVQGYLYLYEADEAHLILNLTPNIMQDEAVYDHLPASYLTQTFSIKRCQKSIDLMLKVLEQAKAYTLEFGRQMIARLGAITPLFEEDSEEQGGE